MSTIALPRGRNVSLTEKSRLVQALNLGGAMALLCRQVLQLAPADNPGEQLSALRTAMAGPLGVMIDTLEKVHPHDTPAQLALRCYQLLQEALAVWAARETGALPR